MEKRKRYKERVASWTSNLLLLTIVSVILAIWFSWGWKVTATLAVLTFLGVVLFGAATLVERDLDH